MDAQHRCVVCDASDGLSRIEAFTGLPRVTSDCKPWPSGGQLHICESCGTAQKVASREWQAEADQIYSNYEVYKLSSGGEQVVFDANGNSKPRSEILVDFLASRLPDRTSPGRLIDLGCGNGAALATFSRALPNWTFDASELSDKALPILKQIPGFGKLYTGTVEGKSYDLVSMIHSLEHMLSPYETLVSCVDLISNDGLICVEVPDIETSPFDILVADHRSHFSRAALRSLSARVGLSIDVLNNFLLIKEITMVARRGIKTDFNIGDPEAGKALVEGNIRWLWDVLNAASEAARGRSDFGIFGTSISAMWLYGSVSEHVRFFIDEDPARIGQTIDGRADPDARASPGGQRNLRPASNEDRCDSRKAPVYRRCHLHPGAVTRLLRIVTVHVPVRTRAF